MHDADREQLDRFLAVVVDAAGPELVAAYLYSSAVTGTLRPSSDLDVLAVLRRPATRDEKQRLVDGLTELSYQPTAAGRSRHLELTVVVQRDVRPWRYPPVMDFQYGDWLLEEMAAGEPAPWTPAPNPDLAVLLTKVLSASQPLVGPPAADVLDPVPRVDLLRAVVDELDGIVDRLEGDERNVVLTLARVWSTVATGEVRSKDAAADWALPRLPGGHRPVLARARDGYRGDVDGWGGLEPRIRPHVDHVVAEIRRVRPASMSPAD